MESYPQDYQVLVVVDGRLELSNNEQTEVLKAGDTVFFPHILANIH